MASERSLYAKIRVVLRTGERRPTSSLSDLVEQVLALGLPSFLTLQYDIARDEYLWQQSETAVRRCVRLCKRLALIEPTGELTSAGRRALRNESAYASVVGAQVRDVLADGGVDLKALNTTSRRSLRSADPELPTAAVLW